MAYSFPKMFLISQNLKHVHMTCSFLKLLILFLKTLVQIFFYYLGFISHHIKEILHVYTNSKENEWWIKTKTYIAWKVSKCRVFSSPYFPVFGLNIQSEYRKIRTRKYSAFGHFSCNVCLCFYSSFVFFGVCIYMQYFFNMVRNKPQIIKKYLY